MENLINAGKLNEMPLTQKAEFIDQMFRCKKKRVLQTEYGISLRTGARYRKLKNLIPKLGNMANNGKLPILSAVAVAYLEKSEQEMVLKYLELLDVRLTQAAANKLKSRRGKLSEKEIYEIVASCKVSRIRRTNIQVGLSSGLYNKHFRGMTPEEITKTVERALVEWYKTHALEERLQIYYRALSTAPIDMLF